ncbi:MAG: bacillithiol system redox-active protein YtxJ [Eudoraea sp.]|nr:bacillithiol system redox-active protein YtxJ [Eudoraea sp.]
MGLWDKLLGKENETGREPDKPVFWKPLTERTQLDEIEAASYQQTQVIFKHSVSCGISSMAKRRFEKTAGDLADQISFHLLVIQHHRDLSNEIATRFQVWHESPQLLVLKDGKVVTHASHWQIEGVALDTYQ